MKIHIISNSINSDTIIGRLYDTLAKHAKFSISDRPDDKADINYFSLYLLYPKQGYYQTKTAALFSHKELNVPSKLREWKRVAKDVTLRLYWSDLYKDELEQYGMTRKITPYLDRKKFDLK